MERGRHPKVILQLDVGAQLAYQAAPKILDEKISPFVV
jgi:hypothetical protein